MAQGNRLVSDVLRIMRKAISKRSTTSPDSTDEVLLSHVNDFISLKMPNDMHTFQDFGTLTFRIDETTTDGVYTFNDVGADSDFMDISTEGFLSIYDPVNNSVSWNSLDICHDPHAFFNYWGINNEEVLTRGYPTDMLFYGNEMTFRTLPEQEYVVKIYGYKKRNNFSSTAEQLPFDHWLRYLAYGAALDYVRDNNYSAEKIATVEKTFRSERIQMAANAHNHSKKWRGKPNF